MRPIATLLVSLVVLSTLLAAGQAPAQQSAPPKLEPLPEAPPPPRLAIDPALEPEVRIIRRGDDKVEEFRIKGQLYMVRVTPPGGTPYVLIDAKGDGQFVSPSQGPADAHTLSVPMWVIKSF